MAVLAALCRQPGEMISADDLLDACWPGGPTGDNPLHKVITGLRRALQDNAAEPRYIETIRKGGYRLIAPVRLLSAEGERSLHGGWRGKSPFRGLQAFDASHASVFFGRDDDVAALQLRLTSQWQVGRGLVLLLGPSGSGKTSLVQAGLAPALLATAHEQRHRAAVGAPLASPALGACSVACVDLGANEILGPWHALAGGMLDWDVDGEPLLSGHSFDTLSTVLQNEPARAVRELAGSLAAHDVEPRTAPPLLVLDRFEALLRARSPGELERVMVCLAVLADSRLLLLLVVARNDFYPEIAALPWLMQAKEAGAQMDLAPPSADAIAQMIRLPARAAGLSFGADAAGVNRLDDRLCIDAMRAANALPLLQYTLQALYQARAPGDELTWQAYEELGGIEGAVGRRAEAVLAAQPLARQEALTQLLPRLVALNAEDASPTGRWVDLAQLRSQDERALVDALVDERLLVSDQVGGIAGVRVAHEALLRCWPRVTGWIAQHRAMLAVRDELAPWFHRWQKGGRTTALLLPRGALLWRTAGALTEAPHLFDDEQRHYVARSLARLKRQTQLRWFMSASVGLLAIVAAVIAWRNAQLVRLAAERELQSQRLASFMLGDLADQLRPVGKLDLLDSIGQKGLELLGEARDEAESAQDVLQRARALIVIGEVNSSRGKNKIDVAVDALHRADALLSSLGAQGSALDVAALAKAKGSGAFWLGQIAFDAGDFVEATRQMLRYRDACEHWLAQRPDDAEAQAELSLALGSLGAVAIRQGDWTQAARWFQSTLDLKLAALAKRPDDEEAIEGAAVARTWLGQMAYIRGRPREAVALYEQAHAEHSSLLERHPEQLTRQRDLAVLHLRRAEALRGLGRLEEASQQNAEAVRRYARAVQGDAANKRWYIEALHAEAARLLTRAQAGQPVEADLPGLRKRLAEVDPSMQGDFIWRAAQLQASIAEAHAAAASAQWPQVAELTNQAERGIDELFARRPHDGLGRELQARLTVLALQARMRTATPSKWRAACEHGLRTLDPIVRTGQQGVVLEAWQWARRCAHALEPNESDRHLLTEGGYVPLFSTVIPSTNMKEQHDR